MRIATTFAEIDGVCDYIPFVSTVSNIVDLFQKCIYKCLPENIAKNRYWTHVKWKDVSRCLILLIPILGNIYVAISDYSDYQRDKAVCNRLIQSHQEDIKSQANMLALLAGQISGQQVTGEQMMPAPTNDQRCLWAACLENNAQPIRNLLDSGISPNFYHFGQTPLVTACRHSTAEVVRLLVERGADVTASDRMGTSPFAAACTKGNLEVVQFLRPHIADLNAVGLNGATALMFAAEGGHRPIVEFLLAEGADPHKKDAANNGDAATNAMFLKDHAHLLPLLFLEDENVDDRKYQLQIPDFNLFSLFASPTIQNLTPLLYATLVGAENSAIYLVERSHVQHVDSTNSNALHYASKHMPLLRALLNKCRTAKFLNQQNIVGSTALHRAIELGQADAALLLFQNGADPFIPDNEGKTPLLLACEKNLASVVEYIQQYCADRERVTAAIETAAARRGQAPQAQPERPNGVSAAFGLLQSGLNCLQSSLENRAKFAQKMKDLGPLPLTGMEMVFGKLPWPEC